jgi:hypothetical protein
MTNSLVQAIVDLIGAVVLAAGFGAAIGLALRHLRRKRRNRCKAGPWEKPRR